MYENSVFDDTEWYESIISSEICTSQSLASINDTVLCRFMKIRRCACFVHFFLIGWKGFTRSTYMKTILLTREIRLHSLCFLSLDTILAAKWSSIQQGSKTILCHDSLVTEIMNKVVLIEEDIISFSWAFSKSF